MKSSKLRIIMFSSADAVAGQGVGSAYEEQVKLVTEGASDLFDVEVNKWAQDCDIQHFHTIDPQFFLKMFNKKTANVAYCHFVPETLEGSLKIPKMFTSTAASYIISFYKAADRLVVVNPSFIDELTRYGIEREKIYYIPNYVDHDVFCDQGMEDRNTWRAKYHLNPEDFVVMGCGQIQTRKGVQDFVEVAKAMPDVKFIWAGGFSFGAITDGYDELKEIVDHPPKNVIFTGIIDRKDMVHIYNLADVLFMPSYAELFPMTILEAVNLSKPMVLRNLDLYKDILFDRYVRGQNNTEFVEALYKLKNDPEYYRKISQESDDIARFYSRENVLEMWRKFYVDAYVEKFGFNWKEEFNET